MMAVIVSLVVLLKLNFKASPGTSSWIDRQSIFKMLLSAFPPNGQAEKSLYSDQSTVIIRFCVLSFRLLKYFYHWKDHKYSISSRILGQVIK